MEGIENRTARYRAVSVLLFPSGRELTGAGLVEGTIKESPSGDRGFGYDPLFVPKGESRTMAELGDEEKNAISHRAKALRALVEGLD
jgi:XTP/dITP diphosphohydrolase